MGRDIDDESLERLLGERGTRLMRVAVALTGSRADGEDLLQAALERLLRNWRRIETDAEGYLWRTLYHLAADGWRRRERWRARLPEFRAQVRARTGVEDVAVVDVRDELVRLLRQLPPRQRAVIVLRYWEQRTEPRQRRCWVARRDRSSPPQHGGCGGCENWRGRPRRKKAGTRGAPKAGPEPDSS